MVAITWKNRTRLREILGILLFYFFFSLIYHIVLWYNGGNSSKGPFSWLDIEWYWYSSGMQYLFYLIASIILCLVVHFGLRRYKPIFQISAIFILIPILVYFSREIRYEVIDALEMGRLTGTGEIWDLYIPWLFMCIQFGCYFAYQYFKENQLKLRTENELRQAALTSEIAAIKAQLNPHFLYNIFNTINASLPPENEKTRDMVAQLSDLFRYQLMATKSDLVPLSDEIEFITKYLDLEKARFEDRLVYMIDIAPELKQLKIPPMLLQPIVENCIKHGLANQIDQGKITIKVRESQKNRLLFTISDNGSGASNVTNLLGSGVGLTNTAFRLEKIYGSTLKFSPNTPSGLIVEFWINKKS